MSGGSYFSFGDLRIEALRFALDSQDDTAEDVVARADLYFQFLVGNALEGNSKIPSPEVEGTNFL